MIEVNDQDQAYELAKNFFKSHPESNQILIPMTQKTPKMFDYAPIIDGKLNNTKIISINIHYCQSAKCDTHMINIVGDQSNYYLQNDHLNSNRQFSYNELRDLGYFDYICFVVSQPSEFIKKCNLAKQLGITKIFQDWD